MAISTTGLPSTVITDANVRNQVWTTVVQRRFDATTVFGGLFNRIMNPNFRPMVWFISPLM